MQKHAPHLARWVTADGQELSNEAFTRLMPQRGIVLATVLGVILGVVVAVLLMLGIIFCVNAQRIVRHEVPLVYQGSSHEHRDGVINSAVIRGIEAVLHDRGFVQEGDWWVQAKANGNRAIYRFDYSHHGAYTARYRYEYRCEGATTPCRSHWFEAQEHIKSTLAAISAADPLAEGVVPVVDAP